MQASGRREAPRVPGLRDRRKIRQREAIVDTAIRLFDERGIDATTMDDIAEAVEVSRATVCTRATSTPAT